MRPVSRRCSFLSLRGLPCSQRLTAPITFIVRDLVEASQAAYGITHIERAFLYLATGVAQTARSLPEMPQLDTPKLTFAAVFALLAELLAESSGGAYEQFGFAALLSAWHQQARTRDCVVDTKRLNTSDASAGTAGDVQVKIGGALTEAYELTANTWDSKVSQAKALLRTHRRLRLHIVAKHAASATGDELRRVFGETDDIAVLDLLDGCARLSPASSHRGALTPFGICTGTWSTPSPTITWSASTCRRCTRATSSCDYASPLGAPPVVV